MERRLRTFAALVGLLELAAGCASRQAQKPPVVDPDSDSTPPAAVAQASAPPPPQAPAEPPIQPLPPMRPAQPTRVRTYPYPVATLPGFEMLPGGGSRVFVDITRKVDVEERRTARALTYVLKGARVVYRNNENALVTVHFNTPVTVARLLPSGRDLVLTIELRADTAVNWKMEDAGSGAGTLEVDFPSGNYLPADGVVSEVIPPSAPPAAKKIAGWRGQGHPPPAAPTAPAPASAPDSSGGAAGPAN
jgi:hypothetical protein